MQKLAMAAEARFASRSAALSLSPSLSLHSLSLDPCNRLTGAAAAADSNPPFSGFIFFGNRSQESEILRGNNPLLVLVWGDFLQMLLWSGRLAPFSHYAVM
jgi:hypothetical protein